MSTFPLGWQSWSPPTSTFLHIPARDYCPIHTVSHSPFARSHSPKNPINYWCSWYALGPFLNQTKLLEQAKLIRRYDLKIDYFIIDDNWSTSPFSVWLKPLVRDLHRLGFKVGLWYAPFTRYSHLSLYPTLDKLVQEYQVDLLKLDFLYQPYFAKGLKDDTLPHQTLVDLFEYLADNYPHVYTIASGCPFAPALGRVDALRISKDSTFPAPVPTWIRRLLYYSRMRLLSSKYALLPSIFAARPDLDVRVFELDNATTTSFWDTIHSTCLGLGDDLSRLSPAQINQAKIWLNKNPSSL
jgi:hypothetical protein